jgi:hypothetical protein
MRRYLHAAARRHCVVETMNEEENCRRKNAAERKENFRRQCEFPEGMEYEHRILSLEICVELLKIICDVLHINLQKQTYSIASQENSHTWKPVCCTFMKDLLLLP